MGFAILGADTSTLGVGIASAERDLKGWDVIDDARGTLVVLFRAEGAASELIRLLDAGLDPSDALRRVPVGELTSGWQLLALTNGGRGAARSDPRATAWFGHTSGSGYVAGGQALTTPNVVGAMSLSFERSGGDRLAERLLFALESGDRAGSDIKGLRSATVRVLSRTDQSWLTVDADDDADPLAVLRRSLRA